jgi:lysyl-tRNA synthetase class 1
LELGKLNWRLEWPAIWKVLAVDVEPFGKDHAAPGGSRDSCKDVAQNVMHFAPPFGIPYEWVGYGEKGVDKGDMGSSDAIGFGPATWAAVGDPEVLRYRYLSAPPSRRILLDLTKADAYHDEFDVGEQAFFGGGKAEEEQLHRRTYELAATRTPAGTAPFLLSYRHAAYLSQISPDEGRVDWVVRRLRDTRVLQRDLSQDERDRIEGRMAEARAWVERYAPENKVVLLERLTDAVRAQLTKEDREALLIFAVKAEASNWQEEAIKEAMVALTKGEKLPVLTSRFFRDLYLVLLGTEKGPRAAPFLAVLDKRFVLERLREAAAD